VRVNRVATLVERPSEARGRRAGAPRRPTRDGDGLRGTHGHGTRRTRRQGGGCGRWLLVVGSGSWISERRASSERRRWRKSTTSASRSTRERHRRCPGTSASSNARSALIPVNFLPSSAASLPGYRRVSRAGGSSSARPARRVAGGAHHRPLRRSLNERGRASTSDRWRSGVTTREGRCLGCADHARGIGRRSCPGTARCRMTRPSVSPSTFRTSFRSSRPPPAGAATRHSRRLPMLVLGS